jgi:hypothetical protein
MPGQGWLSLVDHVCLARLPAPALAVLADLRTAPGVHVAGNDDSIWIRWEAGDQQVLERLLPVAGAEFYESRNGRWHQAGCSMPAFEVPARFTARPLLEELTPAPLVAIPPPDFEANAMRVRLVPDDHVRPTTAIQCGLAQLARWVDTVPTVRLQHLQAAHTDGQALMRGSRLPLLHGAARFWGERVFLPLGQRLEPVLPESAYHAALGLNEDEFLLFQNDCCEIVAADSFGTVTRAGIRQLLEVSA